MAGRTRDDESWYVATLVVFDTNLVLQALPGVVLLQTSPKLSSLYPHDGVNFGVKCLTSVKHVNPQRVFLQRSRLTG